MNLSTVGSLVDHTLVGVVNKYEVIGFSASLEPTSLSPIPFCPPQLSSDE